MAIDPGRMREPIAIQALTSTPDDAGGYTEAWADASGWALLWAELAPLRGQEQVIAQQSQASATHRLRMYAVEGVTASHRIRLHRNGDILEIVAPPTYNADRSEMELLVREAE